MTNTYIGRVAWFNANNKYGFIKIDELFDNMGGEEVYFHIKDIKAKGIELCEGDVVSFELRKSGNKVSAIKIKVIMGYDE